MVNYRWQIYATSGELFTDVGSVIGEQLAPNGDLQVEQSIYASLTVEGYNTTDFLPLTDRCRVIRVVCPVTSGNARYPYICYYTAADKSSIITKQNFPSVSRRYHDETTNQDVTISVTPSTVDMRVQFATNAAYMVVPAQAKYFRISFDGAQWQSASVQCYSAYGSSTYGSRQSVEPIYKDDLGISYEVEGKNRFLRRMLSGSVTFVGADFDKIMAYDWQLTMRLVLQKNINGGAFSDYWEGEFKRTDCAVTYDDKKIVVTPKAHDMYSAILDKYENEYNLIDLAPEIDRVIYQQRPVLQLYTWATGEVQNVIGNIAFRAECNDPDSESDLTGSTRRFAQIAATKEIQITNGTISSVNHTYSGNVPFSEVRPMGDEEHSYIFKSTDSEDYFVFRLKQGTSAGSYNYYYDFYNAAGLLVWSVSYTSVGWNISRNLVYIALDSTTTLSGGNNSASLKCSQIAHTYGRYLTAKAYNGDNTPKVSTNDPFVDISTNNYPYIYTPSATRPMSSTPSEVEVIASAIVATSRYSKTPTKYGRVEQSVENIINTAAGTTGQKYYYLPPNDSGYFKPIMESKWGGLSYWLDASVDMESSLATPLQNPVVLNDAFPLWSCIDVLAKQIDPRLSFKNNDTYSHFLYDTTPVWGGDTTNPFTHLCITQITNVSRGEYTQAAQKGEACLKWFFDLLKNVFNCYWWVDADYKIHIEHISYFENGGTYTPSTEPQAIGKDLTALYNTRNSLKWTFGLGECTYEENDAAARYEFEWAIGATDLFNGNAIEVLRAGIDRKKKEEVSVSHFVADIDYVIAAPSEFSNDAWLFFATIYVPNSTPDRATRFVLVPFGRYKQPDGTRYTFRAQNGCLAFAWLQPRFWTWGMSGSPVSCNGLNVAAASIERMITQKVVVPYEDEEMETNKLIRTSVGDGQIKRAVFELSSRCAQITLKYPMQ